MITEKEKQAIENMRRGGLGYRRIAKALNLKYTVVKYHIEKAGLGGRASVPGVKLADFCPICGSKIVPVPHKRKKFYCSDRCRMKAWHQKNRAKAE